MVSYGTPNWPDLNGSKWAEINGGGDPKHLLYLRPPSSKYLRMAGEDHPRTDGSVVNNHEFFVPLPYGHEHGL